MQATPYLCHLLRATSAGLHRDANSALKTLYLRADSSYPEPTVHRRVRRVVSR